MPVQDWRQGSGTSDDMVSVGRAIVEALAALRSTLAGLTPIFTGQFTMTATATLVVLQPAVVAGSIIVLQAANASAGTLQGSNEHLYISAKSVGVSFTVATAAGTNAAGGEIFSYAIFNPAT